ncbi:MAG TPA: hypothetical protein VG389_02985 [Myxococcota bacterium]|jgi:hypothetical protein|nr:hypothetical protein [Myxococcota bacterium]
MPPRRTAAAARAASPEKQIAAFLAKYTSRIRAVAKAARTKVRARLPGAVELVYDNYNALVIAFGPSDRAGDIIVSLAIYPRWVTLFFLRGAKLPDPQGLLKGSGPEIRHVVLDGAATLDTPPVRALIAAARAGARLPLPTSGPRRVVIKSVSAKQRPRRPPAGA